MDNKLLIIELERGNEKLVVGTGQEIKIVSVEGLESSTYSVHTISNSVFDGSTMSGKKVDERIINLAISTHSIENKEVLRNKIIKFFNPKDTIKMTVDYCGNKAFIECQIREFKPTLETSLWDDFEAVISFVCPYPFFADLDNFGKNIAATTPLFSFPLSFMTFNKDKATRRGLVMSFTTLTDEVRLHNKGDVATGLEVVFIARRGSVSNPKITNISTGEFIEVTCDMQMGDEIKINTNVGKKNIYLNGESIFKQKNKLSTFFMLNVGDNKISYGAKTNSTNLDVKLYYTPKYLGV